MSCLTSIKLCAVTDQTIRFRVTWEKKAASDTLAGLDLSIEFVDIHDLDTVVYELKSTDLITDPSRIEIIDANERIFDIIIEKSINLVVQNLIGDLIVTDTATSECVPAFRICLNITKGT